MNRNELITHNTSQSQLHHIGNSQTLNSTQNNLKIYYFHPHFCFPKFFHPTKRFPFNPTSKKDAASLGEWHCGEGYPLSKKCNITGQSRRNEGVECTRPEYHPPHQLMILLTPNISCRRLNTLQRIRCPYETDTRHDAIS